MQDLRAAVKGGLDPNGFGSSVVAADVLWSDPVAEPGLRANAARGVGLIFGPDVTQVSPTAKISLLQHRVGLGGKANIHRAHSLRLISPVHGALSGAILPCAWRW